MSPNNWLARFARGVRPDRNPVRRASDKLETYLIAGSIAATAAAAPFIVPAVAGASHAAAVRSQVAERTTRHELGATLLQKAADGGDGYSSATQVLARADWRAPDGAIRSGVVTAPGGAARGSVVPVWTDAQGHLTGPPLDAGQIAGQSDLAGAAAAGGLVILLLSEGVVVRRVLERRRLRAWDTDWAVTEPRWTRRRQRG
ncbi:MAG: hypothetical protein FWE35_09615 [Streptosporangiales bacterium]|nr:hypothetical protein [Streptosporangiales bacterium]